MRIKLINYYESQMGNNCCLQNLEDASLNYKSYDKSSIDIRERGMQTANPSKELLTAISSIEELLNAKDGEFILEAIRKFKEYQKLDNYTLQELKHRLSR